MPTFVRFQSAVPNRHQRYPGIFALANGLAADGFLSDEDRRWWRASNDEMNAAYAHPTQRDPGCYDPSRFPAAVSWFKESEAAHLIEKTRGYLALLDRYRIPWVELRCASPGVIHYEDTVQVVSTPFTYARDWPF